MQRYFTYLFAGTLFLLCVFNNRIVPDNLSDRFLGVVKRNIKKDRQEVIDDMKEITKKGLIYFEVYDEAGKLITTLKQPLDFDHALMKSMNKKKFSIKSVSSAPLLGQIKLNTSLD